MTRTRICAALLVVAVALAGAGLYAATRFQDAPRDTIAALVPAEASLYVSFFVAPSTGQRKLLGALGEEAGPGADVAGVVRDVLDAFTEPFGLAYRDVEPWVGRQLAVFLLAGGAGAVIAEAADPDAARAALPPGGRMHRGYAVFGDPAAVAAVTGGRAGSLTAEAFFTESVAPLPADRLALAYRGGPLPRSLPDELGAPGVAARLMGGAASLRATETGLVAEGTIGSDGAVMLAGERRMDPGAAPGASWLSVAVPNLSAAADALVASLPVDVSGTDAALLWAAGSTAGLEAVADGQRAARRLAGALRSAGAGAEAQGARVGAVWGSRPPGRLGERDRYREAVSRLGPYEPLAYLDTSAAGLAPYALAARRGIVLPGWLERIDRVVVGLRERPFPISWRAVISLR